MIRRTEGGKKRVEAADKLRDRCLTLCFAAILKQLEESKSVGCVTIQLIVHVGSVSNESLLRFCYIRTTRT